MVEEFKSKRSWFLQEALKDSKKWCVSPSDMVGGKKSDQYWVACFASAQPPIDDLTAKKFLAGFQLTRMVTWDYKKAANLINDFINTDINQIRPSIAVLAVDLATAIDSKNNGRQTSAASKIAMFAKPAREVYIWDALATHAARFRDAVRTGNRNRSGLYRNPENIHDYVAYSQACTSALSEELMFSDFNEAVESFNTYLNGINGPMCDSSICPRRFIQRRFLDKLMFAEGQWLRDQSKRLRAYP